MSTASTKHPATSPTNSYHNNTPTRNTLAAPLVSACRHLLQPNGSINGDQVLEQVIVPNFPDLCSALPPSGNSHYFANKQAILGVDYIGKKKKPLTHGRVQQFILQELGPQLHQLGYGRGDRIALILKNGPELALAILGIAHWASCLPLNGASGAPLSELKKDLQQAKASLVIGMVGDEQTAAIQDMAAALKIPYCGLEPSSTEIGIFRLLSKSSLVGSIVLQHPPQQQEGSYDVMLCADNACQETSSNSSMEGSMLPNEHENEVLVLFTSGTTGSKKLVPHRLADMLLAAACIAVSWNLTPSDVNCNLMPLFHVGGIVRQVFAPIISGGSVICCPSFDPHVFWEMLLVREERSFSWYYAAPTMHQVILESMPPAIKAAQQELGEGAVVKPKLRMIANAAGGLLPSLAEALRRAFGGATNVLPSYGMTECMPISSPPYNYQLTKPGTSGVAVGPQITIFNSNFEILPPGKEGSICVRGRPCFHGYGGGGHSNIETFMEGGWFNTGDLGYMDEDGYLYVTGRSKEVINRGGEIISPLEVEEEVLSHASVMACVAFSAPHSILQEVVAIVIVPVPTVPKIDLPTLHEYLQSRLAAAKWPQVLVYMDALPKSHTNKLLRVKLGQRLNLPEMNDGMFPVERLFEATCPPQGTPVGVSIPCEPVVIDPDYVEGVFREDFRLPLDDSTFETATVEHLRQLLVTNHPSRYGALIVHAKNIDRQEIIDAAKVSLDAYLQPTHICLPSDTTAPLTRRRCEHRIPQSTDAAGFIQMMSSNGLNARNGGAMTLDPVIQELQEMIQELADLDCLPSPDTSFFQLGGTSLLASQLASRIRKKYKASFSGADIFRHNNCFSIATKIKSEREEFQHGGDGDGTSDKQHQANLQGISFDATRLEPRNKFFAGIFQLLPGFFVFPLWQLTRFFLFFISLLEILSRVPWEHNLFKFICTLVGYHFLWNLVTPIVFVMIKWIVVGKYRKGRYAFWSFYYLRWWFVDVCRKIFGRGIWGNSNFLLICFYRMLGADIAWDARISSEAEIAEFDLVTIEKDAAIEFSTVRGFGVDNGALLLGPVKVGNSSSVGIRSIVAPFTQVPDGRHVGPGTSSYEIGDGDHLAYNRYAVAEPSFLMHLFVGTPITFLVDTFSHLPAMYVLYMMIRMRSSQYADGDYSFETIGDLLAWLCDPARIPYYLGIRIVRATIAPFAYMIGALFVKWTIIGRFEVGPRNVSSQWDLMRHWLAATLFSRENIQQVTDLLGRHYELTSCFYRLLGAKVGQRVFWPGHQPVTSGQFDLLEVGDDVVFGSRSVITMATTMSCERVIFCAGANISDNTVVLPGSIIGKNAVLGSNTVCPAGRYLPPSSTWLGSRNGEPILLEQANSESSAIQYSKTTDMKLVEMVGDDSTLRPFGRAVYLGQAKYRVCPGWCMSLFSVSYECFMTCFHSLPLLGTCFLTAAVLYGWRPSQRDYSQYVSTWNVYMIMFGIFCGLHFLLVLIGFLLEISAKWLLVGRRIMGQYNWYVLVMCIVCQ